MADNESPHELEKRGEYKEAATEYARDGFNNLLRADFEPIDASRIGVGLLLQAISCDVIAGNERRAIRLADICRPVLDDVAETASDPILAGLGNEWRGDVELILGTDSPGPYYDRAGAHFEGMDWRDERWRDEPDFMHCYWAVHTFSTHHDGPLPNNPDSITFQERLDRKRTLARHLLETDE